jgi:hypothetical protein
MWLPYCKAIPKLFHIVVTLNMEFQMVIDVKV